MTELEKMHCEVECMAVELLKKRVERLKKRCFVLFPWLRLKMLLNKIHFLHCCHEHEMKKV
jgi:hypothetical protein